MAVTLTFDSRVNSDTLNWSALGGSNITGSTSTGIGPFTNAIHPGRITRVADPAGLARKVLRFEVYDSDIGPTANPRAQLECAKHIPDGAEFWHAWAWYFPSNWPLHIRRGPNFPSTDPNAFFSHGSAYGSTGTGTMPISWGAYGDQSAYGNQYNFGLRYRGSGTFLWRYPRTTLKWFEVAHRCRFTTASTGVIEIWLNDGAGWIKQTLTNTGPGGTFGTVSADGKTWSGPTMSSSFGYPLYHNVNIYWQRDMKNNTAGGFPEPVVGYCAGMKYYFAKAGDTATDILQALDFGSYSSGPVVLRPSPPATVQATGQNAAVFLQWTPSAGAVTYNVYRVGTTGAIGVVTDGSNQFTDTGRTNGVAYSYQVTAVNDGGESDRSVTATATATATPGGTPPTPTERIPVAQLSEPFTTQPPPAMTASSGSVQTLGGQLTLTCPTPGSSAEARFRTVDFTGGKLIAGGVQLAALPSGTTGEFMDALSLEISPTVRVAIRRRVTPTQDKLECRMVDGNTTTDSGTISIDTPANLKGLALGGLSDNQTVIYMYSTDWSATTPSAATWLEAGRRTFTTSSFGGLDCVPIRRIDWLSRATGTGNLSASVTDIVYGSSNPNPGGGTAPVMATVARTFSGVGGDYVAFPLGAAVSEPYTAWALVMHTADQTQSPAGFVSSTAASGGGRYARVDNISGNTTTPGWLRVHDSPSGVAGFGDPDVTAALNAWELLVWSKNASDMIVTSVYHPATGVWADGDPVGPYAHASTIPSTGVFVTGRAWVAGTPATWTGHVAMSGYALGVELTASQRHAFIDESGIATRENIKAVALAAVGNDATKAALYEYQQAAVTTAVTDQIGTKTESARSGTTVTTGLTIPYATGSAPTTPPTGTSISDPQNLQVVSGSVVPDTANPGKYKAQLTWNANPAPDLALAGFQYVIQRGLEGQGGIVFEQVATSSSNGTVGSPVTAPLLIPNVTNYLAVVARATAASSDQSNVVQVIPADTNAVPSTPDAWRIEQIGTTRDVWVIWTPQGSSVKIWRHAPVSGAHLHADADLQFSGVGANVTDPVLGPASRATVNVDAYDVQRAVAIQRTA